MARGSNKAHTNGNGGRRRRVWQPEPVEKILSEVGEQIGLHFGASRISFCDIIDNGAGTVCEWLPNGFESGNGHHHRLDELLDDNCLEQLKNNKVVAVDDAENDPRTAKCVDTYRELGVRSSVVVPTALRGEIRFWLGVHKSEPYQWSPEETDLLCDIGERVYNRLTQARSEAAVRESETKLAAELADTKLLQSIGAELISEDNVQALYEKLADAAAEIMHADIATIQMLYPERGEGGELLLLGSRGLDAEAQKFWQWVRADSNCTCGAVLRTRERAVVPDMEKCSFMAGTADLEAYRRAGIRGGQTTPLISRSGKLVGMISTHWREVHEPDERDLRLLDILARQASDLIERHQSEHEREQLFARECEARAEAETLNKLAHDLASELDVETLVQKVTDAATELTTAKFGAFFYNVVNEQGEAYQLYTLSGAPREAFEKFGTPRNTPIFAPTFSGSGVVRLDDVTKDARYGTLSPHRGMPKGHLPVRSYLAVPVISRTGEVLGGLFFGHPEAGVFRERHERLITGLAAQAAIAMDNADLFRAAQNEIKQRTRAEKQITGQSHTLEAVAVGRDLTEILDLTAGNIETVLPGARASVLLADAEGKRLFYGSARSLPDAYNAAIDGIEIGEGIGSCGTASFRREPVIVSDIANDPLWKDFRDLALEHDLAACWSHPIAAPDGRLLGTFATYFDVPREPGEEESAILESAARIAGIAIHRKRIEEQIYESEERFRTLADNMHQFAWTADASGWIYWYNQRWFDYTGTTLEEMQGWGWMKVHHPDHVDRVVERIQRSWDTGEPWEDTFPLRGTDGEYRWFLSRALPIRNKHGNIVRWFGTNTDVTEQRQAEEALRQSEEQFSKAFNASPLTVTITSLATGKLLEVNDTFVEVTGYSREEAVGKTTADLSVWSTPADREEELAVLIRDGRLRNREYRFRVKDGAEIVGLLSAEIIDLNGEPCALTVIQDVTDRIKAIEALRESEQRSQLAQNAGNIGIWDWDAEINQTWWSDKLWSFYGEKPRKINPNDSFWMERLHTDDRERVVKKVQQTLASDSNYYRDEYRIKRKNGSIRWLESVATIARDKKNRPVRMYGVTLDVTDKKHVAEQIRASEKQLRLVTDTIPALISYIDANERYRFVNEQYTEWFGREYADIIGRSLRDVIGIRAYKVVKPYVEKVLAGEECSFDARLNYKTAGPRYVHIAYVPDVSTEGKVRGYYAMVNDLSELRRSEDLLRSSQERIATLTENFTDYAIFSTDAEGRIDSWNPGAENIYGYAQNEILGRSVEILFAPEDVAKGVPLKEMRVARSAGRASIDRWQVRKNGTQFFAGGAMTPLSVGGALTGYARITTDLTERKMAAEALQNSRDMLERLVQERTSELNELNAALTAEIKQRKTAEGQKIDLLHRIVTTQEDERRRVARDLHDQLGQRLTALRLKIASLLEACNGHADLRPRVERLQQIAQMLDSEVSFLAWELRPSVLDEHGFSDSISNFVREWSRHYETPAEFHASGVGNLRLPPDTETHLYRIAQEAMNNIVKHAKAKNVSVLLEKTGDEVTLIVEDDGIGFARTNGKSAEKSGNGLGLTGMHERAALIGGTLEIESVPTKGTTIFARVPIENGKSD